jgi:Fe-S-cluster containining protein
LSTVFDCPTCGACCFGRRAYVQVFAHDAARLGPERAAAYVAPPVGTILASVGRDAEPLRFMKMTEGHCAALCITPPNRFLCDVYEDRPTLCRALEPGSDSCLEARARRGIDTPRTPGP